MRFVDDGDVEIVRGSDGVGRQVDLPRIGDDDRLNIAVAAEIEGFDAVGLGRDALVCAACGRAGVGIGNDGVGREPRFGLTEAEHLNSLGQSNQPYLR